MSQISYTDLAHFLSSHSSKNFPGQSPTHTRIPDASQNVFGGAFVIGEDALETFHALYKTHVFGKNKLEHLTEKQIPNGPILIDFDFRYKHDIEHRPHTQEDIIAILTQVYLDIMKDLLVFTADTNFNIYVMEKPEVNRLTNGTMTKDGIHIVIGIQMNHILQTIMRERAIPRIPEVWDLPLTNTYDSVLDEGITKGTTNWQLYGSRKPGNQAYEVVQVYNVTIDDADGEFCFSEIDEFNVEQDFIKLSAQYTGNPSFEVHPSIKQEYEKRLALKQKKIAGGVGGGGGGGGIKIKLKQKPTAEDDLVVHVPIEQINDAISLDNAIKYMLSCLRPDEILLKEIHYYTQILPEAYYASGSHAKNREVAFALKNTDERLFLSWIKLRSRADDFNYGEIMDLKSKWDKYFNKGGLTYKSIIFWAKQDSFAEYSKIKESSLDAQLEESIKDPSDHNFAQILHGMFKDKYICTSIQHRTWYVFENHHWEEDKGETLRASISRELYDVYISKRERLMDEARGLEEGSVRKIAIMHGEKGKKSILAKIQEILHKFKTGHDKNNIFREAAEVFYDKHFINKMDANPYLMCFENGVVDFKNRLFRDGEPLDYITKSTNIPYIPFEDCPGDIIENVIAFMQQLFPNNTLNEYMWAHLASTLIGENLNQTFNIYLGAGSNGKSILVDLMSHTLGKYKGTVPITLITEKRGKIGGTCSEVMQLKGVRYAVMQEPSKNMKVNEGVLKELTGGDPLQGRELFKESETFIPQFTLAVCTNSLFDIEGADEGAWRRTRLLRFVSKFVDKLTPAEDECSAAAAGGGEDIDESSEEEPMEQVFEFLKDKKLKEKLPIWAPIFASMLVKKAFETQGVVNDCDIVMAETNKYRKCQDHIAAFVSACIARCSSGKGVRKTELNEEFKLWYAEHQGGRALPRGTELHDFIDKKFGKFNTRTKSWTNIKITKYEEPDDLDALSKGV